MKKSERQKRREAEAKAKRAKKLSEGTKNIISPQVATVTPLAQGGHKNETTDHAKQAANDKPARKSRSERRHMSGAMLAISGLLCCIFFTIAAIYWGKGGLANVKTGFFWLIPFGITFSVAVLSAYWYYVVQSEGRKESPKRESANLIFSTKAEVVRFDDRLLEFMLKVSNDSDAVAKNVIVQHAFSLGPSAPIDFTHGSPNGPFTISPHKEVPVAFRQLIEPHELARIQNEKGAYLFFYGLVRAEEGESCPFCFVYLKDFRNLGDCASLNSPGTRRANEN